MKALIRMGLFLSMNVFRNEFVIHNLSQLLYESRMHNIRRHREE